MEVIMKSVSMVVLFASMGLIFGCSPISVKTDYDREVDFSRYRTFKWMPYPKKRGKNVVQKGSFEDVRIRRAVENELQAKGYEVKKTGRADALLAYHIAVKQQVSVDRYGYGYWHRHTRVHRYKEGTIVVDVVDPEMKQLIWRGAASGFGSRPDEDKINEAMAKVFEKYPPR